MATKNILIVPGDGIGQEVTAVGKKVLEIGSNIGRNTLIISHILNSNNNDNFVTLESDLESVNKLNENKKD